MLRRHVLRMVAPILLLRSGTGAVAAGAAAAIALAPATAYAHGHLTRSEPRAGSRLTVAPAQLRLTFSEAPELAVTAVRLTGPGGTVVPLAALVASPDSPRTVVAAIRGSLGAGAYTVVWQMAGADGHPTRGTFTFSLAPTAGEGATSGAAPAGAPRPPADSVAPSTPPGEAGAATTPPGQAPAPAAHHAAPAAGDDGFDAASWPYVGVRWLLYVGLLVVLGAVAFRFVVLSFYRRGPHPEASLLVPARRRAARVGLAGALAVGAATLLRLVAQSYAMHGGAGMLDAGRVGTMLARTVWGWGWLLQAAGVLVAATGFRAAGRGWRGGWTVAATGAAALAVTPALSGHAVSAAAYPALAVVADGLHVAAAGGWLGSLLLVLAAGVPAATALGADRRAPALAALVDAFSPTALACAAVAAVTGVLATWLHVGTVPALWGTAYGRTLLLKLGVLSAVAATGFYNWRRVKPALTDARAAGDGVARLRRSATVELAAALVVLLVTAVLVATPTAVDLAAGR